MYTIDENRLIQSLTDNNTLSACSIEQLDSLTNEFPYFGLAIFFSVKKQLQENTEAATYLLPKLALHYSNPFWLDFQLKNIENGEQSTCNAFPEDRETVKHENEEILIVDPSAPEQSAFLFPIETEISSNTDMVAVDAHDTVEEVILQPHASTEIFDSNVILQTEIGEEINEFQLSNSEQTNTETISLAPELFETEKEHSTIKEESIEALTQPIAQETPEHYTKASTSEHNNEIAKSKEPAVPHMVSFIESLYQEEEVLQEFQPPLIIENEIVKEEEPLQVIQGMAISETNETPIEEHSSVTIYGELPAEIDHNFSDQSEESFEIVEKDLTAQAIDIDELISVDDQQLETIKGNIEVLPNQEEHIAVFADLTNAQNADTDETVVPEEHHEKMAAVLKDQLSQFNAPVSEKDDAQLISTEPYHTIDYFASQGIKLSQDLLNPTNLEEKVKKFTDWLKQMKRISPHPIDLGVDEEAENQVLNSAAVSNQLKEIYTEAMAEVYLKQGLKRKAIDIYEKLSFLNPDKTTFFAAKIEQLNTL